MDVDTMKKKQQILSPLMSRFVSEYLIDLNAKQAAIRAGYSEKTAQQQASRLLLNVVVADEIAKKNKSRLDKLEYDAEQLLRELLEENNANLKQIYNMDGSIKPIHEWPDVFCTGLVTQIDTELIYSGTGKDRVLVGRVQSVKFNFERLKRQQLIGRHTNVQAFKEKVVIETTDPLQELMRQISGNSIRPVEN
ncbi:terminase small subunit [Phyllobacterium sp. P5_D12]